MARRTSPLEPAAEDGEGRCWQCLSTLPWPALTSVLLFIPGVVVWAIFANKCTDHTFAFFNVVTPVAPDTIAVASNAVYTTLVTLLVAGTGIVSVALIMAILRGVQERQKHPDSACPCLRTDASAIQVYAAFNMGFNIILWLVQLAIVLLLMGALTWLVVVYAATLTIQNSVSDSADMRTSPLLSLQNATRNYTRAVAVYQDSMLRPPSCVSNSTWLRGLNTSIGSLLPNPLDPSSSSTVLCPSNCLNLGSFATLFKLPQNCVCDPQRLSQLQDESAKAATAAGVALGGLVLVYIACGILHASLTAAYVHAKRDIAAAIEAEESFLRSSRGSRKGHRRHGDGGRGGDGGDDAGGGDDDGDIEQGKGSGGGSSSGGSAGGSGGLAVVATSVGARPSSARSNKGLATVSSPLHAPKQQEMQALGSQDDVRSGHSAPAAAPLAAEANGVRVGPNGTSMDDELNDIEMAAAAGVLAASRALNHTGSAMERAGHTPGPSSVGSSLADLVALGAANGAGHKRTGSAISSGKGTPRHHKGSSGGSAHELGSDGHGNGSGGASHRRSTSGASSGIGDGVSGAEPWGSSRASSHVGAGDLGAFGADAAASDRMAGVERAQASSSSGDTAACWRTIRGLEAAGFASSRRSAHRRTTQDAVAAFPSAFPAADDEKSATSSSAPVPGHGALLSAAAAAGAALEHSAGGPLGGAGRRAGNSSSPSRGSSSSGLDRRSQLRVLVDDSPLAPPLTTPYMLSSGAAAADWPDLPPEPLSASGRASNSPASSYYGGGSSTHSLGHAFAPSHGLQHHRYMDGAAVDSPVPAPGAAISPISEGPEGHLSSGYSSDSGLASSKDVSSSPYSKQAWRSNVRKGMSAYDQFKKPQRSADVSSMLPLAPQAAQQAQLSASDPRLNLSRRYRNRVPAI